MARSFNGTSDYMRSSATLASLATTNKLAVSFWLYSTFNADDDMVMELGANAFSTTHGLFAIVGADSSGGGVWVMLNGSTHSHSCHINTTPSADTWHHWLINFDFTLPGGNFQIPSIYIDGVLQAVTQGSGDSDFSNTGQAFANDTLNIMCRNGNSLFQDGRIADLCLWGITSYISSTDAAALAGGSRAWKIRTSEILYYWPIQGTTSPEPAVIGSTALTVSGAASVADPAVLEAYTTTIAALPITVTRTSDSSATIAWGATPGDAPNGVSVLRVAGQVTVDGNGKTATDPAFDPTTISGASIITSGQTTSPYTDNTLDPSTAYTYCIVRTGS